MYLLWDEQFLEYIKFDLDDFISLNTSTDVNPHTLWETTKCAIRGSSISYSSKIATDCKVKISSLEKDIQQMKILQKHKYDTERARILESLKVEYKDATSASQPTGCSTYLGGT